MSDRRRRDHVVDYVHPCAAEIADRSEYCSYWYTCSEHPRARGGAGARPKQCLQCFVGVGLDAKPGMSFRSYKRRKGGKRQSLARSPFKSKRWPSDSCVFAVLCRSCWSLFVPIVWCGGLRGFRTLPAVRNTASADRAKHRRESPFRGGVQIAVVRKPAALSRVLDLPPLRP